MSLVEREFEFRTEDFRFIASLVHAKTGIVLADHKEDMVYARIARRLRSLNLRSFRDYCALLERDHAGEEIGNFVNAVTTNLTAFFREGPHFTHLGEVLRAMAKNPPPNRRVRLWSAACSSGAEPYSMALTCLENIPDIERWDLKILATDIDTKMLAKAQGGLYSQDEAAPIPPSLRQKYTVGGADGQVTMKPAVQKLITFKQLNLIEPWPFKGPFDAVFCRNVVIYFNKDTQKVLFEQMAARMNPGALLYIGHSESLHGISQKFLLGGKTIYQRVG